MPPPRFMFSVDEWIVRTEARKLRQDIVCGVPLLARGVAGREVVPRRREIGLVLHGVPEQERWLLAASSARRTRRPRGSLHRRPVVRTDWPASDRAEWPRSVDPRPRTTGPGQHRAARVAAGPKPSRHQLRGLSELELGVVGLSLQQVDEPELPMRGRGDALLEALGGRLEDFLGLVQAPLLKVDSSQTDARRTLAWRESDRFLKGGDRLLDAVATRQLVSVLVVSAPVLWRRRNRIVRPDASDLGRRGFEPR